MNTLILNRETFELPADGWYQIAPIGEFPHAGAGIVQVVDAAACEAMAAAFRAESAAPNFAGLLIDFDHFSLDGKQKSEAAGWITALEARVGETEDGRLKTEDSYNAGELTTKNSENTKTDAGLWGKIRWSDAGEACVRGGRYRFLSPVWAKADCEDLGGGRLRPVRLLNAAVTNDPNIKGMVPLSNRRGETEDRRRKTEDLGEAYNGADGVEPVPPGVTDGVEAVLPGDQRPTSNAQHPTSKVFANGSPALRFKWVLGVHDRHCPSCSALAGQVHSMADWDAAGLRPGAAGLFCQGHCHCELVETDEGERGSLAAVAVRKEIMNRRSDEGGELKPEMANKWSDAARAAALAVRRAKAAARKKQREEAGKGAGKHDGGMKILPIDDVEIPGKGKPGQGKDDDKYYPLPVDEVIDEHYERTRQAIEDYRREAENAFKREYGHWPETPEDIALGEEMAGIPEDFRTGGEISPEDLAKRLADTRKILPINPGAGDNDSNPGHQELERAASEKARKERLKQQDRIRGIHEVADGLIERESAGEKLSAQEKAFLKRYREILGDLSGLMGPSVGNRGESVDFYSIGRGRTRGLPARSANRKTEGVMADDVKVVTEGKSVEELANALRFEQEKNAVLLDQVVVLEDELVNRSMSEFEDVVSEGTREFWKQQLLSNREGATAALRQMVELHAAARQESRPPENPADAGVRQPLHNRGGKVRQGSPTGGEAGRASVVDGVAARIRNRAHELCKSEGVPFSVAFRRAEREAVGASRD